MNTVEEKLWNYIDGTCTAEEQQSISLLIEQDEVYRKKYNDLLLLSSEIAAMELDEPPMASTYNVMETIRNEYALTPLKSKINKRIINGIGLFFVFTISAILIFALSHVNWGSTSAGALTASKFTMPNFSHLFHGPFMQIFGFFDVVLMLYLADNYLRKKRPGKSDISVHTGVQQNQQ